MGLNAESTDVAMPPQAVKREPALLNEPVLLEEADPCASRSTTSFIPMPVASGPPKGTMGNGDAVREQRHGKDRQQRKWTARFHDATTKDRPQAVPGWPVA